MEKNIFLVMNDLIYDIYGWQNLLDIRDDFFQRLRIIIPFQYASILFKVSGDAQHVTLGHPICFPQSFLPAEQAYLASEQDTDYLLWNLYSKESKLLRASDVLDEEKRLNSPLYVNCYRKFNVYDDMQLTIVSQGELLGLLTLYRTREDGAFSSENMFFLRALGMHLNASIRRILMPDVGISSDRENLTLSGLQKDCGLTPRETEILRHLRLLETNTEIANALGIRESTLQKHLQNLFRKLNVTSRWEVLRLFAGAL